MYPSDLHATPNVIDDDQRKLIKDLLPSRSTLAGAPKEKANHIEIDLGIKRKKFIPAQQPIPESIIEEELTNSDVKKGQQGASKLKMRNKL